MADITTRETSGGGATVKGSPLTNTEVDTNFINLNTDKVESGGDATLADVTVDSLQFTGGTGTQGTVSWNVDEETLDVILDGATLQMGQEVHYHVRNNTASTISNGTPVMVTGTLGASGRLTIAPMDATNQDNGIYYIGVTTEDIAADADGKATHFGKVRGLDTSAYADGDVLWLSTSTVGAFTTTEPSTGIKIPAAIVINSHASTGTLFCRYQGAYGIHDMHDFDASVTPVDNDVIAYDATSGNYQPQSAAEAGLATAAQGSLADTALQTETDTLDSVTGRGATTSNAITVGNLTSTGIDDNATSTAITIDSSENVGIGTDSPDTLLHVQGSALSLPALGGASTGLFARSSNVILALITDPTSKSSLDFGDTDNSDVGFIDYDHSDNSMSFGVNVTERMRITSNGNVGIGTNNPTSLLNLSKSSSATIKISSTTGSVSTSTVYGGIEWSSDAGVGGVNSFIRSKSPYTSGSAYLSFGTGVVGAASERMVIDASGNVGIGTNSPNTHLDVSFGDATVYSSSTTQNPSVIIQNTTGADGGYSSLRLQSRNSNGGTPASFSEIANVSTNSANFRSNMVFKTKNASNVSVERMRIDINGNVGIGTTSPVYPIDVKSSGEAWIRADGGATNDCGIRFAHGGVNHFVIGHEGDRDSLQFFDNIAGAERMIIDSSGNVGIGTTSPSTGLTGGGLKVEFASTSDMGIYAYNPTPSTTGRAQIRCGTSDAEIYMYATGSGYTGVPSWADAGIISTPTLSSGGMVLNAQSGGIKFQTGAVERMRIDSSGNVGIGTDSPVSFSNQTSLTIDGTSNSRIDFLTSGVRKGGMNSASGSVDVYSTSGNSIRFSPAGITAAATIDTSGNLLVGTTTATLTSTGCRMNASGRMSAIVNSATNPAAFGRSNNGDLVQFYIAGTASGTIFSILGGTPSFVAGSSDARLKENVTNHEPELDNIMRIRPVRFDWKDGTGSGEGVIAQELQEVYPDLVMERSANEEGEDYLTVADFGPMTTRLVKAMQEQQEIIEELRARVAQLEEA